MLCPSCLMGYTWECAQGCSSSVEKTTAAVSIEKPYRDKSKIKDLESTGRKRAAEMYPLKPDMPCEWRRLKFAGGGVVSIIGCSDGIAKNRHHGPDKNTLNNEVGNVHRICYNCHNRYHAANDRFYTVSRPAGDVPWIPSGELVPHNKNEFATDQEILENELKWRSQKK